MSDLHDWMISNQSFGYPLRIVKDLTDRVRLYDHLDEYWRVPNLSISLRPAYIFETADSDIERPGTECLILVELVPKTAYIDGYEDFDCFTWYKNKFYITPFSIDMRLGFLFPVSEQCCKQHLLVPSQSHTQSKGASNAS